MTRFFERYLKFLNSQQLVLSSLVLGVAFYLATVAYDSEIQAFPEFTNVQVKIITLYPGKAAEEVERFVTRPLETGVSGLPGLINTRSVSLFGLSAITLTFDDAVLSKQARLDTQQRIQDVELPDGVHAELEPDASPLGEVYRYVLEGNLPVDEMRMIQDWTLERELKSVPGVTDVVTFGGPARTIDIRLNPKTVRLYNLNVEDIAERLSKNNLNAGGGFIAVGKESFLVRAIGLYDNQKMLENAVVAMRHGQTLTVKDVGVVEIGHIPRLGQVGYNSNDDVVQGIVLMRRGEDSMKTLARVKEKLNSLQANLPEGLTITKTYDRSDLIERSSGTVVHNIVFGIALVVLILVLAFGFSQLAMIVGVALVIPFSLLIAVYGVNFFGYSPNLISLGAVDFGIIVETAILAAEALIALMAVQSIRDQKIVAKTLASVIVPALVCALVLVIAFIPILSLQQIEGKIFRPLGITLVSAVVGGQVGALLFIPWFSRWMKVGQNKKTLFHKWSDGCVECLLRFSDKTMGKVRWPQIWIASSITALIVFLWLGIGKEFLPDLNEGNIWIRARAPSSISLNESVRVASEIRKHLKEIPEILSVVSQAGRPDDGTDSAGFDNIEFSVSLAPQDQWVSAKTLEGMIELCQEKLKTIENVEFGFSQYLKDNIDEAISGVKGELAFKIFGPDIYLLQEKADQVAEIFKRISGAEDVSSQLLIGQPEKRITVNHVELGNYGIDVSEVATLVESSLQGKKAGQILDEHNRIVDVLLYPHQSKQLQSEELLSLPLSTELGEAVSLGKVARLDSVKGINRIYREHQERSVAITLSVRGRDVVGFVQEANHLIKNEVELKTGYHHEWFGSFQNASRAVARLLVVIPICFLMIVLVLRTWFANWSDVFRLLWQIPFSLVGALVLLKVAGLNLSISAASGGIVLCGVAFLTGMMILNEYRIVGSGVVAVRNKAFGVIVSNAVAIIGLIPAALSTGVGAEISRPFAVMIVGGLSTSLILSLFLYPILLPTLERSGSDSSDRRGDR